MHAPSPEQQRLMEDHNRRGSYDMPNIEAAERPFAEYEATGYLIFSDTNYHEAKEIKRSLARELPEHMKLVVFTSSSSSFVTDQIRSDYEPYVGERLKILQVSDYGGFWARDGVPVPVFTTKGTLRLVDAKYYHGFEADQDFADFANADLVRHTYYYEGGNFMADDNGNCVLVNKTAAATIPDNIFETLYGCSNLARLEHLSGIGHADEVVKFLSSEIAVTDHAEYVGQLEALGHEVKLLPKASGSYETYVNALILDNKLFMPAYNHPKDEEAIAIYESFGFEVHPLVSKRLSNNGHGSIHCITMTYPDISEEKFAESFGGKWLH